MKRIVLSLPFKGDRTYLHGTDMYDGALSAMNEAGIATDGRLRFRIHRIARTAVDLLAYAPGEKVERPAGAVASLAVGAAAAFLVETEREVDSRTAYDDNATDAHAALDGDSIGLAAAPGLAPIEAVVAITRSLHRARLAAESGRWMFTGLDLARPLAEGDAVGATVTMAGRLGVSLTKSTLALASGATLGHVFFSLVDA